MTKYNKFLLALPGVVALVANTVWGEGSAATTIVLAVFGLLLILVGPANKTEPVPTINVLAPTPPATLVRPDAQPLSELVAAAPVEPPTIIGVEAD